MPELYSRASASGLGSPFNLKKMPKFAAYFADCKQVLELGPGSGEFLRLLDGIKGVRGVGVEADKAQAASLKKQGLNVLHAEALQFMRRLPAGRYDGLFASNVVEHMDAGQVAELLQLASKKLGGAKKLAFCTANPACLPLMQGVFWDDPQHVRPYSLATLAELCSRAGLKVTKASADEDSRPHGPLRSIVRALRKILIGPYFGPPEIYILAQRPD